MMELATRQLDAARRSIEDQGVSLYEELANAVTHLIAAVLAAAGLALLVVLAAFTDSALAVATSAIYGATLFFAFLFSALYHGTWHRKTKAVFLLLDHCSIFTLIAGTYTPLVLLALEAPLNWWLFGVIWGLAVLGIGLRLWFRHLHWSMIPIFLVMGWMAFFWSETLHAALGSGGLWLLIAGALVYTSGLIFFAWRRLPFNHAIWHLFVVGAAICHFLAIAIYVLPKVMPEGLPGVLPEALRGVAGLM